jgi:hypothetical protein
LLKKKLNLIIRITKDFKLFDNNIGVSNFKIFNEYIRLKSIFWEGRNSLILKRFEKKINRFT